MEKISKLKYIKALIKKLKRQSIYEIALKRRNECVKIDVKNKSISELEAVYHQLITE